MASLRNGAGVSHTVDGDALFQQYSMYMYVVKKLIIKLCCCPGWLHNELHFVTVFLESEM